MNRRAKIQSGERTTSFYWLLNDKRGAIGRMLSAIPSQYRLVSFIAGQFGTKLFFTQSYLLNVLRTVYTLVTEIPAVFLLYNSPTWSAAFILFILAVSVWNGGGFYIEVFGRKYVHIIFRLRYSVTHGILDSNVNWKP